MSRLIPVSGGRAWATVDDDVYEDLSAYQWHFASGYAKRKQGNRSLAMSRHILGVPNGTGHRVVVDHINGDKLDNRRSNLRICTQAENVTNSRKRRTHKGRQPGSRHKGVSRNGPYLWRARINVGGRALALGSFYSEEEAAEAYRKAAVEHFGEFAHPG